jgi:hypothetical protein
LEYLLQSGREGAMHMSKAVGLSEARFCARFPEYSAWRDWLLGETGGHKVRGSEGGSGVVRWLRRCEDFGGAGDLHELCWLIYSSKRNQFSRAVWVSLVQRVEGLAAGGDRRAEGEAVVWGDVGLQVLAHMLGP